MDALSDLLRAVRLTGAVYFDIRARAPWVAESPAAERVGGRVMPEFDQVIFFHIVLEGHCWAALSHDTGHPVRLGPGEAIVIPGGEPHVMSSAPGMRAEADMRIYRRPEERALPYVFNDFGGAGAPTRYACGFLGYDRPFNPVLDSLPRLMHVSAAEPGAELLVEVARAALRESENPQPGAETLLGKLGELVFLQALRQHVAALPADATGWFAGLRDRHVGRALALMHADPNAGWSLEALAEAAGLSRSVFAARFMALIGVAPMKYLTAWRLQLAAHGLAARGLSVAQAAAAAGYESEAAFSRAFRKHVGVPPGTWRRAQAAR